MVSWKFSLLTFRTYLRAVALTKTTTSFTTQSSRSPTFNSLRRWESNNETGKSPLKEVWYVKANNKQRTVFGVSWALRLFSAALIETLKQGDFGGVRLAKICYILLPKLVWQWDWVINQVPILEAKMTNDWWLAIWLVNLYQVVKKLED